MPTTFANSINNNLIYADRAEHDAAGNDIATTYATKGEIPSVPVTDVEVDGVSVVSSGVASITMPTFTQSQANWNESDTSAASYIQNKPSIPAAQVNADWNASSGVAEILNKPTIPTVPSAGNMLSVTNNTLDVTTTAGITDVQQVNALPQNPVSTVLYLIPET